MSTTLTGKIRTESHPGRGQCHGCHVKGLTQQPAHIVLPPEGAPSDHVGLSSCGPHLEVTQRVVTLYADDLPKIDRILANA